MLFRLQPPLTRAATTSAARPAAYHPHHAATWERPDLRTLLQVSPTLAGLCITGVAFLNRADHRAGHISGAHGLAFTALLFLLCTYCIFFALRTRHAHWAERLDRLADALFMLALTCMVVCGFIMVYTML